jgi:hypothetical protein
LELSKWNHPHPRWTTLGLATKLEDGEPLANPQRKVVAVELLTGRLVEGVVWSELRSEGAAGAKLALLALLGNRSIPPIASHRTHLAEVERRQDIGAKDRDEGGVGKNAIWVHFRSFFEQQKEALSREQVVAVQQSSREISQTAPAKPGMPSLPPCACFCRDEASARAVCTLSSTPSPIALRQHQRAAVLGRRTRLKNGRVLRH